MYKTREAVKLTGLHGNTLRRYADKGTIPSIRLPSGQRLYDVDAFLERSKPSTVVCYCRVSSAKQRDDLVRQSSRMRELYPKAEIVEEVGGGLNFKRKGLLTLLERAMQGEQLTLVVAHRDRLVRFGFNLIEFVIRNSGGKVVVLDESVGSPERELTEDLLAILHHFSCRMHGSRSRKQNKEGAHLPDKGAETSVQEMVRSFQVGLQQHCGVVEPANEAETLDGCS